MAFHRPVGKSMDSSWISGLPTSSWILGVGDQRDRLRIAEVAPPVEERGDDADGRPDAVGAERLPPDVEELAKRVCPLDRRFDVDDPVCGVGLEPGEAGAADDEVTDRCSVDAERRRDADAVGDLALPTVDEDRQVDVDVVGQLFERGAGDAVDLGGGVRGFPRRLCRRRARSCCGATRMTGTTIRGR